MTTLRPWFCFGQVDVLAVEPGVGGQRFDPDVLPKVVMVGLEWALEFDGIGISIKCQQFPPPALHGVHVCLLWNWHWNLLEPEIPGNSINFQAIFHSAVEFSIHKGRCAS